MIDFGISHSAALDLVNTLTPRQRQVAEQVAMGLSLDTISLVLGMARKTVDVHLIQVRRKLGVNTNGVGKVWFAAMANN